MRQRDILEMVRFEAKTHEVKLGFKYDHVSLRGPRSRFLEQAATAKLSQGQPSEGLAAFPYFLRQAL